MHSAIAISRLRTRRVDDPDHRQQGQVLDKAEEVAVPVERGRVEVPLGDHHHPLAAPRHPVVRLEGQVSVLVRDWHRRPVRVPVGPAARDQDVGRTLHVAADDGLAARARHLVERRHELVLGIERDLRDPRVPGPRLVDVQPSLRAEHDQGAFGRVADQAVAVEHGVRAEDHRQQVGVEVDPGPTHVLDLALGAIALTRHREPVLAGDRQLAGRHLVQREGPRLVGADRGRRTEGLHGGQPLHDRVPSGDLARSEGEQRGDDRGQTRRDRRDRERHPRDEERVEVLAVGQPDPHHDHQRDPGDRRDHLREAVELLLQRRLLGIGVGQHVGDMADLRAHAGLRDDHLAPPAGDGRVHVGQARPVAERDVLAGNGVDRLADGQALARERGLLDLEGRGDDDPAVGGDAVPRLDQDHVARHELLGVDLDRLAVAPDAGDRLHHLGQRLDARLGLRLLAQADDRVEHCEAGEKDRRPGVVREDRVEDRRHEQDDLHEVLVLPHEGAEPGLLLGRRELVRAM